MPMTLYVIHGTDIASVAICLCPRYEMPGADIAMVGAEEVEEGRKRGAVTSGAKWLRGKTSST
eukprot:2688144-Rhodomonas_salina.1